MICRKNKILGLFSSIVEVWKDIKDYEGVYQVSSFGNVRSLDRYRSYKNTEHLYTVKGRVLKQKTTASGYNSVHLRTNKESWPVIHRLVALAFIDNPENKNTVNHKDGVKSNNTLSNLEWATESEQMIHAISTNLYKPPDILSFTQYGTDSHNCKLEEKDIKDIKQLRESGKTYKSISILYKVGISQIFRICKNQSWKWMKND